MNVVVESYGTYIDHKLIEEKYENPIPSQHKCKSNPAKTDKWQ